MHANNRRAKFETFLLDIKRDSLHFVNSTLVITFILLKTSYGT